MPIDPDLLILRTRDLLTDLPEAVTLPRDQLFSMIGPAIAVWQAEIERDPEKRQLFTVTTDNIVVVNNVADIADAVNDHNLRLDKIKDADIEVVSGATTRFEVKMVNSHDRLRVRSAADRFFAKAYLSGTRLTIVPPGASLTGAWGGEIRITGLSMPQDLEALPQSAEPDLAIIIADIARKTIRQQNRGLDRPVV